MQTFKRNQVEEAIAEVTGQSRGDARTLLGARLKRLLETDREALPRITDAKVPPYAFFDGPPPGKGVEVSYSAYTAFALLVGIELMRAGLPQGEVVWFLRRVRRPLEIEHKAILARGPEKLIDHRPPFGAEREVKLGLLVRRIENMTFMVVPANIHVTGLMVGDRHRAESRIICRSPAHLRSQMQEIALMGVPMMAIEIVNPIHRLAYWLRRIEPVKRGR